MTDETRILRTVGIPVVIAIILLVMIPKMCARAVIVSKTRKDKEERAIGGGLRIESTQKPVNYPAGLDVERIRYLLETDNHFSQPFKAHILKQPQTQETMSDQQVLGKLLTLGYVERAADNSAYALTRDGMLHVDGVVEDSLSLTIPVATRQFEAVTSIDTEGSNAHIAFTWQWHPTTFGAEVITSPYDHHKAKADFASMGGRWSLTQVTELDNDLN